MSLAKKLFKHPHAQPVLSWLLALYIRLVYATSRKLRHVHADALPYIQNEKNAIFAFWHGRMMMLPAFNPNKRRMRVLISHHRDGRLISRVIGHFGQATIAGSSSRGGEIAAREILALLEAGDNVSITPDGPRGPAQVASRGIVTVARLSGKPILPVTFSSRRHRRFRSWDRFMLALPFSRIAFCVGKPIAVSPEADDLREEAARMQFEQAMNALVEEADRIAHG